MSTDVQAGPSYRHLALILVVAAGLRLGLLASAWFHKCELAERSDEHGYHLLARNLAQHHRFTMAESDVANGRPDLGRTPGFPALVALVYLALGERPYAAAIVLVLISCCTVAVVYLLSLRFFGRKVALASGLAMAATPAAVLYAGAILTDTLHTALVAMSLLPLSGALRNRTYTRAVATGIWLGLAILVRPITAYLPALLGALLVALRPHRVAWLLVPAVACVVTAPWCFRNMAVSGRYELSSIGRYNLTYYNLAFAKARAENVSVDEVRREYHNLAKRLSGGSRAVARCEIPKYWRQLLLNQAIGAVMFWVVPDRFQWGYWMTGKWVMTRAQERLWDAGLVGGLRRMLAAPGALMAVVQAGLNLALAILATIGLVMAFRSREPATTVFAMIAFCYASYYALLTGPVACGRYHMAVEPLVAVFAGPPLFATLERLGRLRRKEG